MLILRKLVVVSASAAIALGYSAICSPKAIANEQNIKTNHKYKTKSQSQLATISQGEIFQKNYLKRLSNWQTVVNKIAQMTPEDDRDLAQQPENQNPTEQFPLPEPSPPAEPEAEPIETIEGEVNIPPDVRPSPNPLLFPTKPEEVKIEAVRAITLQQAVELALINNKQLRIERQNLESARASLREFEAGLFPTIDSSIQYNRDFLGTSGDGAETLANNPTTVGTLAVINEQLLGPLNAANIPGLDLPQQLSVEDFPPALTGALGGGETLSDIFTARVGLDYLIYSGGRVKAQIRQVEKQIRRQQLQVEVTAQIVRAQATQDYYNLQSADAQVEIDRAAVDDAQQSLRDAQLLEQAGLGTRFSVLQSEVDLANVQQRLTTSIAQQQIQRRQLATTLGVGQQIEFRTAEEIQEAGEWNLTLEESIVLAYKNRAELEQFLLEKEIQQEQQKIEFAAIKPNVNFFVDYNVQDNLRDDAVIADGYRIGAVMNWTIFDGGRAIARADRAEIQGQIAETNFANERHTIRFNVENAYYNLIANKENITTTTINVERAEENLRLARLRFQAGVGTQTEVIDAQRDLADARGQRLRAINDYNLSLNQLQREISNLPDNQLFEVP